MASTTPVHQPVTDCSDQPKAGTTWCCSTAAIARMAPAASTSAARTLPVPTSIESARSFAEPGLRHRLSHRVPYCSSMAITMMIPMKTCWL